MSLLQELVKKELIDKEKVPLLEFEIKEKGKREEDVLLEKGLVSEALLFSLKSEKLNIPLKEVIPEKIPLKVLELIPEETVRHYQMIPLDQKDNFLEIGMVYPEDLKAQEALRFLSRQENFSFKIFLITPSTFQNLLKQYRTLKKEVATALEKLETEIQEGEFVASSKTAVEFARMAEEAPVSKIVAVLIKHAVDGKASDIHIEPGRDRTKVRFRLLGNLHSSIFLPKNIHPAIIARVKILSNLRIDETRIPQDGRFSTRIDSREVDFRVSTFPTPLGEKVVIRVLDPSVGLKKFEELGLSGRNFKVVEEAIEKPYGLILVTGPTGSGKTTTLYAILNLLNKEGVNIVTLEDPVEYFIEGINQSQIRPEIGYSFATGLRHILRQDPDIIMVGEIRDEETAALTIHAALTGHIVLSTLHTNDALGAIPRLIDLGIKSYLLPPTLRIVLAQRLARKLCPFCKKEIVPTLEVKNFLLKKIENLPPLIRDELKVSKNFKIYKEKGCSKCNQIGFSGRLALFEVLTMTDSLAEIILREISEIKMKEEARNQAMITLEEDGILKVLEGLTTLEEVLMVTAEK